MKCLLGLYLLLRIGYGRLAEVLLRDEGFKSFNKIRSSANTVYYIKTEIADSVVQNKKENEEEQEDDEETEYISKKNTRTNYETRISVYHIHSDTNTETLISSYIKHGKTNTFFVTLPYDGDYNAIVEIKTSNKKETAIDLVCEIYSGDPSNTEIKSHNDVEINKANRMVKELVNSLRSKDSAYFLSKKDYSLYYSLSESIVEKATGIVILKLIVTLISVYYSGKKTREFYAEQKISNN